VRLFFAINLPEDLRRSLVEATQSVRDTAPDIAWVDEERVHLTLKFLGEQPQEMVARLEEMMTSLAARHREIHVSVQGLGAFPNFRRARVVWLGVDAEPRLELLHHDLEVECERLGFELEGRPFRPHLTLARVKRPLDEDAARMLARAAKRVEVRGDFVAHSLDLMRSQTSPRGSIYTPLVTAGLRSR